MKLYSLVLSVLLFAIIIGFTAEPNNKTLFNIPTQIIYPYHLLGDLSNPLQMTVKKFQISQFVTYAEYKEYLKVIKADSSENYYLTQLPDSNIGHGEIHNTYITSDAYDALPVIGISWENAMNFLKWKTLRENKNDSIRFIFRLPQGSEWLAAYKHLEENDIKHDFNALYSDWLLSTMDESYYSILKSKELAFDYCYFHKPNDPPALKRKLTLGDSYLFQSDKLLNYRRFSFYSYRGYRHIGFRYVKGSPDGPNTKSGLANHSNGLLKWWGLQEEKAKE